MTRRSAAAVAAVSLLALTLGACSTVSAVTDRLPFLGGKEANKTVATEGERVSIIAFDQKVEANEALKGQDFFLPEPTPLAAWPPSKAWCWA